VRCTACGERTRKLQRHHYAPETIFGALADTFPLKLLCAECHAQFHVEEREFAKRSLGRLEWCQLMDSDDRCERCSVIGAEQHGETRVVRYAFWSIDARWHSGALCYRCFDYFAGETRRWHKKVGA